MDVFDVAELKAYMANSGEGSFVSRLQHNRVPGQLASSPLSPLRSASLDLVLAIGAQCIATEDAQQIGHALFRGAQRQASSEMLQDPDLEMVRTYLLMAFYMLGACRRNTAYMYLSVATRAAIALGLHSQSSYPKPEHLQAHDRLR